MEDPRIDLLFPSSEMSCIFTENQSELSEVHLIDGLDLMQDVQPQANCQVVQISSNGNLGGTGREAHDALFAEQAVDLLGISRINTHQTVEGGPPAVTNVGIDGEVPQTRDTFDVISQNVSGRSEKIELQTLQPLDVDIADENNQATVLVVPDSTTDSIETVVLNLDVVDGNNADSAVHCTPVPILPKDSNHDSGNRRRGRRKKPKVYELPAFTDEKEERKRLNAINSRNNRLKKKEEMEELQDNFKKAIQERNRLQAELKVLKETNDELEKRLEVIGEAVRFKH